MHSHDCVTSVLATRSHRCALSKPRLPLKFEMKSALYSLFDVDLVIQYQVREVIRVGSAKGFSLSRDHGDGYSPKGESDQPIRYNSALLNKYMTYDNHIHTQ